jgi:membrane protease YdiL (CAAX protease family)
MLALAHGESLFALLTRVVNIGLLLTVGLSWAWAISQRWSGRRLLPQGSPRTVPWGEGSVLLVILAFILFQMAIGFLSRSLQRTPEDVVTPTRQIILASLFDIALVAVVPVLLRITSGARPSDFGLSRQDLGRNVLRGAVAFLLVAPFVYLTYSVALKIFPKNDKLNDHPVETMLRGDLSPSTAVLALISAVVLAPLAEELIFRGVLQGWLTQLFARAALHERPDDPQVEIGGELESRPAAPPGRLRSWYPILITSVLFAAIHSPQMPAPIALFVLSIALGLLYQRTGSLVPALTLHALFNAFSTVSLLFSSGMMR